jgi:hypothetical protein
MAMGQVATLKALDAVLESAAEARQSLRQVETTYRRFRSRIEKGKSVAEAFDGLGIPEGRQEIHDRLADLERTRHEARRAIIALGVSEGLSMGELARLWGVSRQLVSRIAKGST